MPEYHKTDITWEIPTTPEEEEEEEESPISPEDDKSSSPDPSPSPEEKEKWKKLWSVYNSTRITWEIPTTPEEAGDSDQDDSRESSSPDPSPYNSTHVHQEFEPPGSDSDDADSRRYSGILNNEQVCL